MVLYAGLYKMSCDMCGKMGMAPVKTIVHPEDGSKADICSSCYQKCLNYPKFQQGVKDGAIKVTDCYC